MSGYNFAIQISVDVRGSMEKCGFEPRGVNNIDINTEIPKHLETAVLKIPGWISAWAIRGEGTILKIF